MSNMYKCDRCKKPFAEDERLPDWTAGSNVFEGALDAKPKNCYEKNLCPKCTRDFGHFMYYYDEYKLVKRKKYKKKGKK